MALFCADEPLDRRSGLPPQVTPGAAETPPPAQAQDALASLPAAEPPAVSSPQQDTNDVTGSIDEMPGGAIPVEIGETSSTELPLRDRETLPPVQPPASLKPPHETAWGGYAGYFADPDGHLWEVAWNPHTDLT